MSAGLAGLSDVTADPGTNVLVSGPVMTGKRRLSLSLVTRHVTADDGAVLVTTRSGGSAVAAEYERLGGEGVVDVVDCVGRSASFGRTRGTDVHRVSDPGDLTGIGIATTKELRTHHAAGRSATLWLHSLSTMVMYTDLRRVFQFLHVLTGRLAAADFRGVFVADDSTVSGRELDILSQPFDARIEVRDGGAGREYRVRGDDIGPRTWTAID